MSDPCLPLDGVRVVEFSHMVMGPACGMMLADLGAEVIKVEPLPHGDNTRRLTGSGAGYFAAYNRNKKSMLLDLKSEAGRAGAQALAAGADVVIENFRPGALEAMGLGAEALRARNPRLVYCSLKGFLPGPYERRTALDEIVQLMGGLAWMTGPPGRPLRAGASVNDVMGGLFGAFAVLAALYRRERSGCGEHVQSGLFENNVFLMGQHMMQQAVSGAPVKPMSVRQPAWGVYDLFETADGASLFIGVVTDRQWQIFVEALRAPQLAVAEHASNALRVAARERLVPAVAAAVRRFPANALEALCERNGLPFARVRSPSDLFEDPHLNASGGLLPLVLPDGSRTRVPALPIAFGGKRPGIRLGLPRAGEHDPAVRGEAGAAAAGGPDPLA